MLLSASIAAAASGTSPPLYYDEWRRRYDEANNSPDEQMKMKMGKPNAISNLQDEVESYMTLQGATAIEDKLQDGVPELLADLREAGVKIWMLTGDKAWHTTI